MRDMMSGICCRVVGRGTRVGVARGQGGWALVVLG